MYGILKLIIMFSKYILDFDTNLFDQLSKSNQFDDITKGRKGAILLDCKNDLIPLVRTTTGYREPAQKFSAIHYQIIENIKKATNIHGLDFNNAMIEIYDSSYRTMKYHTDQSLDLDKDSYICIFSCYTDESKMDIRKLEIKNKITEECSEVLLEHNSIVLFSVAENSKHVHKIVLDKVNMKDKQWLGITFRLSKTFIKFADNVPHFHPSNNILRLANDEERHEFMKHKGNENLNVKYNYPDIDYTISPSDLLPIK